jgi:cytochrome c oxidase subunit 2
MGLALLFIIWLITLVSTYFFAIKKWWMPAVAAAHGAAIDRQMFHTYIAMGVVFLAAQLALGWCVWKYRDRIGAGKVHYSHGSTRLEVLWTAATAVLFLGLAFAGVDTWAEARFQGAGPGAMKVEVSALQFAWYFRYPGPDGAFARTRPDLQNAEEGNAVGIDDTDPAAKDDVVTGTLFLPVNREVEITLRAQDVIHSLFIPAMRYKQDAVPGLLIRTHFTPTQTGDYEMACAELCGLGHYKMKAMLRVVSQQEFDQWLAQQVAEKQQ